MEFPVLNQGRYWPFASSAGRNSMHYAPLGMSYVIGWSENCDIFYLLWPQKQNLLLLVDIETQGAYHVAKNPEISVESQMEQ